VGEFETLVPIRAKGNRAPLYCVHPISGSAYCYTGFARSLDAEQPVYGFEAPGFDDNRRPATSVEDLSAEYVDVLREFRPHDPYYLLGWSMGGVVAFDMSVRLAGIGADVPLVILVDAAVPVKAETPAEKSMLRRFIHDLTGVSGTSASEVSELDSIFARFPDDADPDSLFADTVRSGVLPIEIDAEFLQYRYTIFRSHIKALFSYEISVKYHGPVLLIKAAESAPEFMRWDTVATDVEEHTIPGDHHSIWMGDSQEILSGIIRRRLDAAGRRRASSGIPR